MRLLLLMTVAILATTPSLVAVTPEILLIDGKITTLSGKFGEAEALAVHQGRIVAVGKTADLKKLAGAGTKTIDLKGRRVVPGFIDSHVHMLKGGLQLSRVALKDAKNEEEFGKRLREFDEKLPSGRWMLGGEWDHDRTFAGKLPDAAILDKYVKNRPVFLRRYDGHMGLANSKALKLAGIDGKTPDPAGGVIYRKENSNEPTGILRNNATFLVDRLIPAPSDEEIVEGLKAALAQVAKAGITAVADMDGSDLATKMKLFRLYQRMQREGTLHCRVDLRWPLSEWKKLADLGITQGFGGDYVRIGGLKGFVDGSLGSSTARMFDAYVNEPSSTGVFVTAPSKLREWIGGADKAGLMVTVHAIGDRANAELLDIYAETIKVNGKRDRRFRIEHAQHLRPKDIGRFGELGVIASMQPFHIADDGRWAEGRIGKKRCESSYALRSLLDSGAKLAFGSDWSVAPLSPLEGIEAAVTRRTLDGLHPLGWIAEQKITTKEALEAYTMGSAYAMGREKELGSLEVGKWADLVVLSGEINSKSEIELTMVGGKVIFEKKR